jgi:hypothetical protein
VAKLPLSFFASVSRFARKKSKKESGSFATALQGRFAARLHNSQLQFAKKVPVYLTVPIVQPTFGCLASYSQFAANATAQVGCGNRA